MRSCLIIAMLAALATGCVAGGKVGYSVAYAAPAPDLVYVAPGVRVIADYDYPVFFADGVYWRYDGGVWYRSRTYTGGWAITYTCPSRCATSIDPRRMSAIAPPPSLARERRSAITVPHRRRAIRSFASTAVADESTSPCAAGLDPSPGGQRLDRMLVDVEPEVPEHRGHELPSSASPMRVRQLPRPTSSSGPGSRWSALRDLMEQR